MITAENYNCTDAEKDDGLVLMLQWTTDKTPAGSILLQEKQLH